MKRDMDVVRKIILAVAEAKLEGGISGVDGVDKKIFAAHAQLLVEADLVRATLHSGDRIGDPQGTKKIPASATIHRLTWAGQDFASTIVDDTLWRKACEDVIKPTVGWTFGLLKEYLKAEVRNRLGFAEL